MIETDYREGSRTAKTSGIELFIAMVSNFYQWTIVTKISEHTGFDDKAFQLSASPFLKVGSKQHCFLMLC